MPDIQQKVEQNLREMHQHLSRADKYNKDSTLVIVDRNQMLDKLQKLSASIYDLLDKYEMTSVGKDRARREMEREREEMKKQAQKQADDIHAAAVMYTDNALNGIIDRIEESRARIDEIHESFMAELSREEELIKSNKLELQSRLQTLEDTKVYMQAIEEANKRIANEMGAIEYDDKVTYEAPEIHVNEAYIRSEAEADDDIEIQVDTGIEAAPADEKAPAEAMTEKSDLISQDILPEDVTFDLEKPRLFPRKKNRKIGRTQNNETA